MADEAKRTRSVRVATYNIHRGRGLDGRTRLERIAAVLASIDADIARSAATAASARDS